MTQEELITRINAWLPLPMSKDVVYLTELNSIYFAITGIKVMCKGCNYTEMKRVLKNYLTNYQNQSSLNPTTMANKNSKYQFTTAAKDETIILHQGRSTKAITADSITDEDAEFILNDKNLNKAYGHNIQLKPSAEASIETEDAELERTRAEFEEITGQKAGNRKLEALISEIERKKNETAAE